MSTVISLQKKIQSPVLSFFKNAWLFVKKSLLISLIFSTILYILMRVFFIGVEFDTAESIELYTKTFLITCFYINAWRVICLGIIWLEINSTKVKFKRVFNMQTMKRAAIFIMVAGLAYKVKANPSRPVIKVPVVEAEKKPVQEVVPQFYLWMK